MTVRGVEDERRYAHRDQAAGLLGSLAGDAYGAGDHELAVDIEVG